ncbi:MAG: DNA-binding protein [Acidovorax sp.]|nr:MAG: DNA-binding protein [Acidovorax sp.]
MATAKKTVAPAKKTTKAAAPAAVKKAAPAAKKAAAPAAKKPSASAAKKAAAPAAKPVAAAGLKPIKTAFNKTTLVAHLAEQAGVEPKATKAVLAALEAAILGSVHKKGSGEFTLPGLMKIGLQQIPAKKKRFGKDPFTGEERWFPAKPAAVKIKTRALKKLKDATA